MPPPDALEPAAARDAQPQRSSRDHHRDRYDPDDHPPSHALSLHRPASQPTPRRKHLDWDVRPRRPRRGPTAIGGRRSRRPRARCGSRCAWPGPSSMPLDRIENSAQSSSRSSQTHPERAETSIERAGLGAERDAGEAVLAAFPRRRPEACRARSRPMGRAPRSAASSRCPRRSRGSRRTGLTRRAPSRARPWPRRTARSRRRPWRWCPVARTCLAASILPSTSARKLLETRFMRRMIVRERVAPHGGEPDEALRGPAGARLAGDARRPWPRASS